jgi:hypothetical protein
MQASDVCLHVSLLSTYLFTYLLIYLLTFSFTVAMILKIAADIRYFLLILALVLVGFAQAFYAISYGDSSLNFGSVKGALLNSFFSILGNFDSDYSGTASPALGVFLLIIFLLFMSIIMLNLLIALMGESFDSVSANKIAKWRLEQASIILEQAFLLQANNRSQADPIIHVLKYTSDVEDASDDITMSNLQDTVTNKFKELKESFQSDIKSELAIAQTEIAYLNEMIKQQGETIKHQSGMMVEILGHLRATAQSTA